MVPNNDLQAQANEITNCEVASGCPFSELLEDREEMCFRKYGERNVGNRKWAMKRSACVEKSESVLSQVEKGSTEE